MSFQQFGEAADRLVRPPNIWELMRSFSVQSPHLAGFEATLFNLRVILRREGGDGLLMLHAGYIGDGPSVPGIVPRWIIDADDEKIAAAAWVHDGLYHLCRSGQIKDWQALRAAADLLFYEMMVAKGVPRWRAKLAYWALRVGGARSAEPRPDIEQHVRVLP